MVDGHVVFDLVASKAKGKRPVLAEIEESQEVERNSQCHLE
jgi:hypothetical protein